MNWNDPNQNPLHPFARHAREEQARLIADKTKKALEETESRCPVFETKPIEPRSLSESEYSGDIDRKGVIVILLFIALLPCIICAAKYPAFGNIVLSYGLEIAGVCFLLVAVPIGLWFYSILK